MGNLLSPVERKTEDCHLEGVMAALDRDSVGRLIFSQDVTTRTRLSIVIQQESYDFEPLEPLCACFLFGEAALSSTRLCSLVCSRGGLHNQTSSPVPFVIAEIIGDIMSVGFET